MHFVWLGCDASGQPLIRTSRLQANGTASYDAQLAQGSKLGISTTVSFTDKINHEVSGNVVQPAFTVVNGNVSWTSADEHIRATIFGNNISGERYIASILVSSIATAVTFSQPAKYGVRLEYSCESIELASFGTGGRAPPRSAFLSHDGLRRRHEIEDMMIFARPAILGSLSYKEHEPLVS